MSYRRRRMRFLGLLIVALSLVPALASAQVAALDEAVAAYEAGNIEVATTLFRAAEQSSRARPADLQRIHRYLGLIHTIIGEAEAAERSFAIALALDPAAEAPAELAPEQRARFEEIRAASHRLEVNVETVGVASNERDSTLRLTVPNAPPGVVAQFRASAAPSSGGQPWTATIDAAEAGELSIPAMAWRSAEQLDVTVEALNEHGGVLRSAETRLSHQRGAAPEAALVGDGAARSDEGGSVVEETWFWVVIGLIVAGGAAAGVGVALTVGPESYVLEAPTIQR